LDPYKQTYIFQVRMKVKLIRIQMMFMGMGMHMPEYLSMFVNHVTIKFRMWNTMSQERFEITFILTNKKISVIEFRKCFSRFIKSVTLFYKCICSRSITNMDIFNRGTGPNKTDTLLNVNPIIGSTRIISILMWIINYSKIKIVLFIVNLGRNSPITYGKN